MKLSSLKKNRGFVVLLEIVIVLVIICIVFYFYSKRVIINPIANKEVKQVAVEQGIDTTNARSVVNSTKNKLNEISALESKQFNQIDDINK